MIRGSTTLCSEDARVNVAEEEDERIENLVVGDPAVSLHAGFATRIVSLAIDLLILVLLAVVLASVFWLVSGLPPTTVGNYRSEPGEFLIYWGLYFLLVFSYSVFMTASEGQTFGKQAMRIAVVDLKGTTPTISTASMRFLYSVVSFVCLGVGFFAIIKDPEKRAWHDHWANSYVISLDEATERL